MFSVLDLCGCKKSEDWIGDKRLKDSFTSILNTACADSGLMNLATFGKRCVFYWGAMAFWTEHTSFSITILRSEKCIWSDCNDGYSNLNWQAKRPTRNNGEEKSIENILEDMYTSKCRTEIRRSWPNPQIYVDRCIHRELGLKWELNCCIILFQQQKELEI